MKYILSIMAVLTLVFGGVETTHAEIATNQMQAYSVDVETANIPVATAIKPPVKKKAKTTKPKTTKKTTKKVAPKPVKKKAAKATTKKSKKTAKAKPKAAVSATSAEMEPANLDDIGDVSDPTITAPPGLDISVKDDQTNDLPEASPAPSKKGPFKGLAVATSAAGSGLGLMFLIRKLFFH
jgi:outer membrane biosynthesis protein TonB